MSLLAWLARVLAARLITRTDIQESEHRLMTAVQDAVTRITAAVEEVKTRFGSVDELEEKLAAERALTAKLVSDAATRAAEEDAEDVGQNQALADAQAATDAALADVREVPGQLDALSAQLESLGADEPPAEEPTPAA